MVDLTATVPDWVAHDVTETIDWVRQHLDHDYELNVAVTEALLGWVADTRLEFMDVDLDGRQVEASNVPVLVGVVPQGRS